MLHNPVSRNLEPFNGINLFWLDTEGNKPPIVCLHGRWGRAETWVDFIEHYSSRYRIVAPDQRGHGLSDKPDSTYAVEEMAADVVALLDRLGIERTIVVGHSMGGYVAGWLAAMRPERVTAVAILDKSANGPDKPTVPRDEAVLVDPVTKDWPLPFSSRKEARDFIGKAMDSDLSREYFINSLVEKPDGVHVMFSRRAMALNVANYRSWFELLPNIECPAMLVRSSDHEAVPDGDWERMRSSIRHCTAFEMSKPDHNVHLSDTLEFYDCFDSFLKANDL